MKDHVGSGPVIERRRLMQIGGALAMAGVLSKPHVVRAATRYTIAMVPKALDLPVFAYGHFGALKRAAELGDVDLVWTGSTTQDANQQAQVVSGLVSRHVDGIALSAVAPEPLMAPIRAAADQGAVVTTWDSDVPGSKRKLFYGVDSYKMGVTLAQELVKLIGTSGKVVLESGSPGAVDQNTRLKGALDTFKQYPGITTVGPFFQHDDLLKAQALTNELIVAHPDAAAILMASGTPLFGKISAVPGLVKNNGKIKIVATDNASTQMPFVKEGLVQVLVGQDYWGWGYQSIGMIHSLLTDKSCKYPDFVPQSMPVITAANVDTWIDRWKQADSPEGAAVAFKEAPIGCM
jgi:ribose transport system substrate-binding protein